MNKEEATDDTGHDDTDDTGQQPEWGLWPKPSRAQGCKNRWINLSRNITCHRWQTYAYMLFSRWHARSRTKHVLVDVVHTISTTANHDYQSQETITKSPLPPSSVITTTIATTSHDHHLASLYSVSVSGPWIFPFTRKGNNRVVPTPLPCEEGSPCRQEKPFWKTSEGVISLAPQGPRHMEINLEPLWCDFYRTRNCLDRI